MPYLPPLQPGKERPRLAPGPRKSQQARDQRTRGNRRSRGIGVQPIRWPQAAGPETAGAANPEADTAGAAAPTPRRQGAAAGCAAARGGARGFPASRGASPGRPRSGARVWGRGLARAPLVLLVGAGLRSNGHRRPCGTSVNVLEPSRPPRTQHDCPSVLCSECVGGPRVALARPRTSRPATLPPCALLTLRVGKTGCCRQQTTARVEPIT